ncbi:hypothetical protein VTI28DRAFT_7019 [Corynascus sepedonium]
MHALFSLPSRSGGHTGRVGWVQNPPPSGPVKRLGGLQCSCVFQHDGQRGKKWVRGKRVHKGEAKRCLEPKGVFRDYRNGDGCHSGRTNPLCVSHDLLLKGLWRKLCRRSDNSRHVQPSSSRHSRHRIEMKPARSRRRRASQQTWCSNSDLQKNAPWLDIAGATEPLGDFACVLHWPTCLTETFRDVRWAVIRSSRRRPKTIRCGPSHGFLA